jgi:surface polysaccharide O-acyltransferase-like enzyme
VAVFFISSGFGLSYSQADKIGIIPYYKKRFKIVPPYIFWTVLYFFVTHFRGGMFGFSYGVITGNTYYHMYFIAVLIVFYILFPFIHKICKNNIGFFCVLVISVTFQMLGQLKVIPNEPFFYNWIVYFALGIYLASHYTMFENIKKIDILLFVIGLLSVFVGAQIRMMYTNLTISIITTSMRPAVILYSVGIIALFIRRFKTPNIIFKVLDSNSMNIYYVHPLILVLVQKSLTKLGVSSEHLVMLVLVEFVSVVICSLVFSIIQKKIFLRLSNWGLEK